MKTSTKTPRSRLALEALEDRLALSSVIDAQGRLVITGTGSADNVHVSTEWRTVQVNGGQFPGQRLTTQLQFYRVTDNGVTSYYFPSFVRSGQVVFHGGNGNDTFVNDTSLRTLAYGGDGEDTLVGGSGSDILYGERDKDTLKGRDGRDSLDGGDDGIADHLEGGAGLDRFQQDLTFTTFGRNRDYPVDFELFAEEFYNLLG